MPPAVDTYRLAGDEVAVEQPQHYLRDFDFAAPAPERRRVFDRLRLVAGRPGRRDDRSRRDRVDEDIVGRELRGENLGERDNAALGDVVRHVAEIPRTAAARD